jgi:uncharacterized protein (DUF111 family)
VRFASETKGPPLLKHAAERVHGIVVLSNCAPHELAAAEGVCDIVAQHMRHMRLQRATGEI